MGQAKLRGAFEQRQAEAVAKRLAREAEQAADSEKRKQARREARGEPVSVAVGTIGHSHRVSALVMMALAAMSSGRPR